MPIIPRPRRDLDRLLERIYMPAPAAPRDAIDWDDSPVWVLRDGRAVLISLREEARWAA
jgi:hypothetical protein